MVSGRVLPCLTWPEEVEQNLEFGSAAAPRAVRLFRTDHVAAGGFQRAPLQADVLIDRRDAGIAIGRHRGRLSQKLLDLPRLSCQNVLDNSIETEIWSHCSASVGETK
jgi:hypothetical protein